MLYAGRNPSERTTSPDTETREEILEFATALVANRAEAAHLVDEAYMRLSSPEPRRMDEVRRLKQIVHNIVVRRRRDFPTEVVWEEVETKWERDEYTVKLPPIVERLADPGEIGNVLWRLPFIYRSVVILADVEGWTARGIATSQDLSPRQVAERVARARMMIVTALARDAERNVFLRQTGRNCYRSRLKFSPYLDGFLPRKEGYSVDRHLKHCPTCPPLYGALVAVRDSLAPTNRAAL